MTNHWVDIKNTDLIVIMGGVSGGIAFSILMPLLQINQFVQ